MIDAATRAPAGGNMQIWHFLVVRDVEKRRQIGDIYWEVWKEYGNQYVEDPANIDKLPKQMRLVVRSTDDLARNIGSVPVHLFICGPEQAGGTIYPAVQNALLSCRAWDSAAWSRVSIAPIWIGWDRCGVFPKARPRMHCCR